MPAVCVVGSHLQLTLPAVNVVCRLVQLLQLSLFTENTPAMENTHTHTEEEREECD